MSRKPIIIAIEGMDGIGKNTQCKELIRRLSDLGKTSKMYSFPNYFLSSGQLIRDQINNKEEMDNNESFTMIRSVLYGTNRAETLLCSKDMMSNHDVDVFIMDRYIFSNFTHNTIKFDTFRSKMRYISTMWDFETRVLGLPKPDINIILYGSPVVSLENITKRNDNIDANETLEYIDKVFYELIRIKSMLNEVSPTVMIKCTDNDGMLPIEVISDKIFEEVTKLLMEKED